MKEYDQPMPTADQLLPDLRAHFLKVWPSNFDATAKGDKPWEYRIDDRDFCQGDRVYLAEFDPAAQRLTGRWLRATIGHMLRGRFGIRQGHVVFTLVFEGAQVPLIFRDRNKAGRFA